MPSPDENANFHYDPATFRGEKVPAIRINLPAWLALAVALLPFGLWMTWLASTTRSPIWLLPFAVSLSLLGLFGLLMLIHSFLIRWYLDGKALYRRCGRRWTVIKLANATFIEMDYLDANWRWPRVMFHIILPGKSWHLAMDKNMAIPFGEKLHGSAATP